MYKQTMTITIAELYIKAVGYGLGGHVIGNAYASEFDVEIEYSYRPGARASGLGGRFEDADPGYAAECDIKDITASANVHFEGDDFDVTFKRGKSMIELFTGSEIEALCDKIVEEIERRT